MVSEATFLGKDIHPEKLNQNNPVAHETETQRQYVRIPLPCICYADRTQMKVVDISSGGFQVKTSRNWQSKGEMDVKIFFPLHNSTFHTKLKARQVYHDADNGISGFRFTQVNSRDISLIRNMVQNYLAGILMTDNDLIQVMVRGSTPAAPRASNSNDKSARPLWLRMIPMSLIVLGGLAGLFLIGSNAYEKAYIVKSYSGLVEAEKFTVRAKANGNFYSLLAEGTTEVNLGQPVAIIKAQELTPGTPAGATATPEGYDVVLKSPCDCHVARTYTQDGEFRALGEPVYDLLPKENTTWVTASVDPKEAYKLEIHDDVGVKIAGESTFMDGNVVAFLPPQNNIPTVKIRTSKPISQELIGRPAYVEFQLN